MGWEVTSVAVCRLQSKERKQVGVQSSTLGSSRKRRVKGRPRKTGLERRRNCTPARPHGHSVTNLHSCHHSHGGTECPAHASLISCVHHTIIHEVQGGDWLTAEPAAGCGLLPKPPHSHLMFVPRALPRCQWSSPFLSSSVSFHRSYSTTRGSTGCA